MKALIFAAGLGTRLRPLTDNRPKALVEVAGRPMLEHVIRHLISYGFTDIVVNTFCATTATSGSTSRSATSAASCSTPAEAS